MGPNFKDPVLVDPDTLKVEGQFDTHGEVIGNVMVGFLIIPDQMPDALSAPISGLIEMPASSLTKRAPDPANPDVEVTTGTFVKADVSNTQYRVGVGHKVRVIGLSVAVKRGAPRPVGPPDAPAFETFTWCVDRTIT